MRRTMKGAWALGLLALVMVTGCSEAQNAVNRVQPNAVDKSTFEGEFYFQQTVIDTPYSTAFTFVGEQGSLQKIRWEIQENYLVARRTYEWIAGSEGEGIAGPASETGAAVAMFAIQSHFDIRREYNPVTGEETNVISENNTDRPWYEREYMRVDWSKNIMESADFLALNRLIDGVSVEPMAWFPNDPNDPNAPKFELDAEGHLQYMDIVNKVFVTPSSVYFEGWGSLPVCYLGYNYGYLDCNPSEISVRNSFLRVDPSRDYEPNNYSGDRMERFGYFLAERPGFDPHYGAVEAARARFAARHNIWQKSHRTTDSPDAQVYGNLLGCSVDEDCADQVGSTCDMDLAVAKRQPRGACTIPYRDREVRKIAYHVSDNMPASLMPDSEHLVTEWNKAFVATVGSLRFNECVAAGGDATSCADQRTRDSSIFVLCHNPVTADDDAACGGEGTSAQIGDLRHHLIGWVGEPHYSSPLGYGPSSADPETGEIIMSNAFIYGSGVETISAFGRDLIALLNGQLSIDDVANGVQVEQWVNQQMGLPTSLSTGREASNHVVEIDGHDAARINKAMDFRWARALENRPNNDTSTPAGVMAAMDEASRYFRQNEAFGTQVDVAETRLARLRGTDIETALTTTDMRAAAHIDPRSAITPSMLDAASPLRGMSPRVRREIRELRETIQRGRCVLATEFADDGLLGLAREVAKALPSAGGTGKVSWYGVDYSVINAAGQLDQDAIREMLRHPIYEAVTAHEVGHTLGLRHNFSGSYDAVNYFSKYWELRDDGHMEGRAWDPMSEQEINGRIREYQYSTVMDYGNNFISTDAMGIGHYDYAAIKMGYGDLVEVFDNIRNRDEIQLYSLFLSQLGWPFAERADSGNGDAMTTYQYTDLPDLVGGRANLESRADVPYTSLRTDPRIGGDFIMADQNLRPVVPYMFCSDEQADLGPDCQRYDAGADSYEATQSLIDSYWNYYIFASFRRGRLGYDVDAYIDRIMGRYFEKFQAANQQFAIMRPQIQRIWGLSDDSPAWSRNGGLGSLVAATGAAYNLFTRVITAPGPGSYGRTTRPDGTTGLTSGGSTIELGILDGRDIETSWNFDAGYYWFDQLEHTGYFYDKALAVILMTDPTTHFVGRDSSADIRQYQLSFYTTFGPSVTAFYRGLLSEDWNAIAPRPKSGSTTNGALDYPDPLELVEGGMVGDPVDPNASFSVQLFAAVYSMALLPATYDQTYMTKARIFIKDSVEEVRFEGPKVEFTDPETGFTYVAGSYMEGGEETGVGAQMLNHAQTLLDRSQAAELHKFMDNINIVRRLSWELGVGVL